MSRNMIWCDLETTGLDPHAGRILEAGFIVTNSELETLDTLRVVIYQEITERDFEPIALDMHKKKTGLFYEVQAFPDRPRYFDALPVAEESICEFLDTWKGEKRGPICGSSVHFDRSWLEVHMPRVMERFSHRNIDVSSFMEFLRVRRGHEFTNRLAVSKGKQRAIEDLNDSIGTMRNIARLLD